jgi:hypothetical protein
MTRLGKGLLIGFVVLLWRARPLRLPKGGTRFVPESWATLNIWSTTGSRRRGPEVWFWDVTTPSGVFQSKVVVYRLAEFLLAAEIAFSCLNRGVPE